MVTVRSDRNRTSSDQPPPGRGMPRTTVRYRSTSAPTGSLAARPHLLRVINTTSFIGGLVGCLLFTLLLLLLLLPALVVIDPAPGVRHFVARREPDEVSGPCRCPSEIALAAVHDQPE
jgi:hypothetical protein